MAASSVDTLADGIRITRRYDVRLRLGDSVRRFLLTDESVLSRALSLRSFATSLSGSGAPLVVGGTVRAGVLHWSAAHTRTGIGDSAHTVLSRPVIGPSALPFRVAFSGRLSVGQSLELPVFDPLLGDTMTARVQVTADSVFTVTDSAAYDQARGVWTAARHDTVRAWRTEVDLRGAAAVLWVDAQGQVVEGETPEGYRLRRSAFELIAAGYRPTNVVTSDSAPAVAARLDAVPAPRAALAVRLAIDAGDSVWTARTLSGGRQRLSGDTVFIRRESAGDSALRAAWRLPSIDPRAFGTISATPFLPSGDSMVRVEAARILGTERRPREAALRLAQWVAGNVTDPPAYPGTPDVRRALAQRRGDAPTRAAIFTTLARAAGLPARAVAGLVEQDGRWHYHSWAEVFLSDWVAVDPSFGRLPVEASYLRLVTGATGQPIVLVPLVSRLQPTVVSSSEQP